MNLPKDASSILKKSFIRVTVGSRYAYEDTECSKIWGCFPPINHYEHQCLYQA